MADDRMKKADSMAQRKRKAYVIAAKNAFLTHGFGSTTMSSIAASVGGSKTTLWSYFRSKKDLFAAVVDEVVQLHARALSVDLPQTEPVTIVLDSFARALLDSLFSPDILALHRLVVGEAQHFPHLARMFFARGPERGLQRLTAYMDGAMKQGGLRTGDPATAASQFISLCQAANFHHVLFGMREAPDSSERIDDAACAVETFLRAWAAEA
ncbi:TetR/AcrR family transcriptional regulator [Sphingopyxis sp. NJF-3]